MFMGEVCPSIAVSRIVFPDGCLGGDYRQQECPSKTEISDDKPIAYRRHTGPIASSAFPACRLGQGDSAQLSCNRNPTFDEVYRDKVWRRSLST